MKGCKLLSWSLLLLQLWVGQSSEVLNFLDDFGAIAEADSPGVCAYNSRLLSQVLTLYASGKRLVFPANTTFNFQHGVYANDLRDSILQIDGTLRFQRVDLAIDKTQRPFPSCIEIDHGHNVTVTSDGRGLIDGRGPQYWGVPGVGYLEVKENRPRLLRFNQTSNLLIEKIILQDSPYHTLYLDSVSDVEIRDISIISRRTNKDGHSWVDLSAFNTDGIDVSGSNVWIHDVDIWTQDDCIAVKDDVFRGYSSDMVFERINASGLGFVIGSIHDNTIRNITFRNSYLHKSVKGIYLKFAKIEPPYVSGGLITDILYENITMEAPTQWPVWIGPAQQADARNPCHPNPCSLCWPMVPTSKCHVVPGSTFGTLTLRNVQINNPKISPGVILASDSNKMENLIFDNVRVTQGEPVPMARYPLNVTFPGRNQPIHDPYVKLARHGTDEFLNMEASLEAELTHIEMISIESEELFATQAKGYVWAVNVTAIFAWTIFVILLLVTLAGSLYTLYLKYMETTTSFTKTVDEFEEPLISKMTTRKYHLPVLQAQKYSFLTAAFIAVVVLVFLQQQRLEKILPQWPFHKPAWEQTNQYYRCEGVANGIATGGTWPVPTCFNQQ